LHNEALKPKSNAKIQTNNAVKTIKFIKDVPRAWKEGIDEGKSMQFGIFGYHCFVSESNKFLV
jgi:hypothetical protein